jgi:hypothetical protein
MDGKYSNDDNNNTIILQVVDTYAYIKFPVTFSNSRSAAKVLQDRRLLRTQQKVCDGGARPSATKVFPAMSSSLHPTVAINRDIYNG